MFSSVQSSSKANFHLTSADLGSRLFRFAVRSTPDSSSPAEVHGHSAHDTRVRTGILVGVLCTMFVVVWSVLICRARRRKAYAKAKEYRIDQYKIDVERGAVQHQHPSRVATPESQVPFVRGSSTPRTSDVAAPQYYEGSPMFTPSPLYSQQHANSYLIVNHSSPNLNPPPPAYTRP